MLIYQYTFVWVYSNKGCANSGILYLYQYGADMKFKEFKLS